MERERREVPGEAFVPGQLGQDLEGGRRERRIAVACAVHQADDQRQRAGRRQGAHESPSRRIDEGDLVLGCALMAGDRAPLDDADEQRPVREPEAVGRLEPGIRRHERLDPVGLDPREGRASALEQGSGDRFGLAHGGAEDRDALERGAGEPEALEEGARGGEAEQGREQGAGRHDQPRKRSGRERGARHRAAWRSAARGLKGRSPGVGERRALVVPTVLTPFARQVVARALRPQRGLDGRGFPESLGRSPAAEESQASHAASSVMPPSPPVCRGS